MEYNPTSDECVSSFHEAGNLMREGSYKHAAELFQLYIDHGADDNLKEEAKAGLLEAKSGKNQLKALFNEGQALMDAGDYLPATNMFQFCIDFGGNSDLVSKAQDRLQKTSFYAGNVFMGDGNYNEAIRMFQRSIDLDYDEEDLVTRATERMYNSDIVDGKLWFLEEECDDAIESGDEDRKSRARSSFRDYFTSSEQFFLEEERRRRVGPTATRDTVYINLVDRAQSRLSEAKGILAAKNGEFNVALRNYQIAVVYNPENTTARERLSAEYAMLGEDLTSFAHDKKVAIQKYGRGRETSLCVKVPPLETVLVTS